MCRPGDTMKRLWILLLLLVLLFIFWPKGPDLTGKRVAVIVAPMRFKDSELLDVNSVLTELGAHVEIFSIEQRCRGIDGLTITCKPLDTLDPTNYDALVLIGGPGSLTYYDNEKVLAVVHRFFESNKVIGAICLAPGILANAGILKGRKATVWWREGADIGKRALEQGGATLIDAPVVVDGKIVTANGPEAAKDFARTVAEVLAR